VAREYRTARPYSTSYYIYCSQLEIERMPTLMDASGGSQDQHQPKELSAAKRLLLEQRLKGRISKSKNDDVIRARPSGTVVPISAEQHRIWLHAESNPNVPIYNEAVTVHRRGPYDHAIFEAAFNEFIRRHEIWRTSIGVVDGELAQTVHADFSIHVPLVDLSHLPKETRESEAVRLATHDAARPIPLDSVPLFRILAVRMSSEEHRIYLTLHHVIFDGISVYRIMIPELAALYDAYASGNQSPLPEPPLQYGDYSIWRRNRLASPEIARSLEYWKQQLSGDLPVLRLPADRNRPPRMSNRGSMECFFMSPALLSSLRAISQAHGVTMFMTLLAAYKALLFRYSGQPDIIIGAAADARRRPELDSVFGYFLDTLPIRTHPTAQKRFSDFLTEVRDSLLGAIAAGDVPFNQIVQAVQPQRSTQHHAIFQAFFALEPPATAFPAGWDLTQMDVDVGAAKFDVYLELEERTDGMAGRFLYNTDIFDAAAIRRMIGHWQTLLAGIVTTPECAIGKLPLLTNAEMVQLCAPGGWNDTARDFPDRTLHELIESQANRTPDKIAAVYGDISWTYRDLLKRAHAVSNNLRELDVEPGAIVAVVLHRSLDMLAGLLGILQAGAAYLPLDPHAPASRRKLCLEDAKPAAILTQTTIGDIPADIAPLLFVDALDGNESFNRGPARATTPDDLAYVIYTSGTTGDPKGVEISHSAIVNLLTSMQVEPGFSDRDRLLAVTTVSFDIAALELFLPLISGGTVILASREVAQDPSLLARAIESSKCTVMQATPATWLALLSSNWKGPRSSRKLKILCGGEPLSRELAQRLLASGVELWNMYGPTETTVWSTVHLVKSGAGAVSIGKPIANTTAYILDEQYQLVPVGVQGKLYLGGAGLARGYHDRPLLTADRFVQVQALGGVRLYCTGDLAVRRPDGTLECLGRIDNQVKVRGFRVELEAVEAAVRRHPKVAAAAARVWPDAVGSSRLSVYDDGSGGPPPDASTLRQFLSADLPDFMIPSDFVPVQALPLSLNGKIDRALLPPPQPAPPARSAQKKRTVVEDKLASIWKVILNVESFGPEDSFFDLGGHSLLVATLQQRIAAEFGQRPSMAMLFQAHTFDRQAALLGASAGSLASGILPLQPSGSRPTLFWLHPPPLVGNLATALGGDQPMVGITLSESDVADLGSSSTFQHIVARHVEKILRVQPSGPYYLGGLCLGGIVAYEAASQLRRAGHTVELVILLDAQNPRFFRRIGSVPDEFSKAYFYLRQALLPTQPQELPNLRQRLHSFVTRKVIPPMQTDGESENVAGNAITLSAAYRYEPPPYSGSVLLLQPKHRPHGVNHMPGWKSVVTGQLIAKDVEGHHDQLLNRDVVHQVAGVITAALAGTDSQPQAAKIIGEDPVSVLPHQKSHVPNIQLNPS
jgi:amino acid adenylation domain-containing protein